MDNCIDNWIDTFRRANLPCSITHVEKLTGGKNNQVFLIHTDQEKFVVKKYFPGGHDRQHHEARFLEYCAHSNISTVPRLLFEDKKAHISLLSYIDGISPSIDTITHSHITQACQFIIDLQRHIHTNYLPTAIDSCFTTEDIISGIHNRLLRLERTPNTNEVENTMHKFVQYLQKKHEQTIDHMHKIDKSIHRRFTTVVSPSDFGFHNALLQETSMHFLDFEYAGMDSIEKLLGDFFSQPRIPIHIDHLSFFCEQLQNVSIPLSTEQMQAILPLFKIKWCTILLNEFTTESQRRDFALSTDPYRKASQLQKAITYCTNYLDRNTPQFDLCN